MRIAALAAVLLLVLTACGGAKGTPEGPARLPDVTLPGIAGAAAVDLGELKGPVVVNMWASYCVPCKRELPIYQSFAEEYDGRVDVLGVRYQESIERKSLEMLREAGVSYPNVSDDDGETRTRFLPRLVLVDEAGHVVHDEFVEIDALSQLAGLVERHLGVTR